MASKTEVRKKDMARKTDVKLELPTDIDRLLMIHWCYHSINRYATVNNKYMKDYDKNKESNKE